MWLSSCQKRKGACMVNWFSNSNIAFYRTLSIINLSMYALPMHSYMAYLVIYVLNDLNIDEV